MICGHVRIEDGANLKDCYIGANYTVIKDGKGCVHVYMTHSHIYLYTHTHTHYQLTYVEKPWWQGVDYIYDFRHVYISHRLRSVLRF